MKATQPLKQLTLCVALLISILALVLPSPAQAGTGLGQSLSSVIRTRIPLKTDRKQGITRGKVMLFNKTKRTGGTTVYGGMTLVITSISRSTVALKNLSGYTEEGYPFITIPNSSRLLPKRLLKDTLLKFHNPERKRFKITFELYGSLVPSQITAVSAPQISSGATVTVTGTGFTRASNANLNGQRLKTHYKSDHSLIFTVPFNINTDNQLVPVVTGTYRLRIDSSNEIGLKAVNLPTNPNPPGQVLTTRINTAYNLLSTDLPQFQALVEQLRAEFPDKKAMLELLNKVIAIVSEINSQGPTKILEKVAELDPTSLDTLERAILLQASAATALKTTAPTANFSTLSDNCTTATGKQWFICRKTLMDDIRNAWTSTGAPDFCGILKNVTAPGAYLCKKYYLLEQVIALMSDLLVTDQYGRVTGITLNIAGLSTDDGDTIGPDGTLFLNLDNVDNRHPNPSINKKMLVAANVRITKEFHPASTIGKLIDMLLSVADPGDVIESVLNLALGKLYDWKDAQITKDEVTMPVTPSVLKHEKIYELYDRSLVPSILPPPCNIHDSQGYYAMRTTPSGANGDSDWWFGVPEQGASLYKTVLPLGECDIKIADEFRLSVEDDISAKIHIFVTRHAKATIAVTGNGYVTYGAPTISGHDSCTSSLSPCTEYFEAIPGKQVTLWARNPDGTSASFTTWSGSDMSSGSCEGTTPTCTINLDAGPTDIVNDAPPSITATIEPNPIIGTWVGYGGYGQLEYDGPTIWIPLPYTPSCAGQTGCSYRQTFSMDLRDGGTGRIDDIWNDGAGGTANYGGDMVYTYDGLTLCITYMPSNTGGFCHWQVLTFNGSLNILADGQIYMRQQ